MTAFSWNLAQDLRDMLQYAFMRNAFEAGTAIAIVAGVVSYFVVLRRSSFAAHSLAHAGFSGAAGAVLLGVNPVFGLLAFTTVAGTSMALLGPRAAHRDMEIGSVLAFTLGLGLLFISLYKGFATETYSILFGEVLAISGAAVATTLVASVVILLAVAIVYKPLLFSSLDEEVAEAKGTPTRLVGILFMLLVAVAVSFAVQVIGVLLIFSLLVTPAAIAIRVAKRPAAAMMVAVAVSLAAVWIGLFVSWFLPYPVSFFITTLVFALYLLVRAFGAAARRVRRPGLAAP